MQDQHADLDALLRVRSQRTDDLIDYCRELVKAIDRKFLGRRPSEFFVEPELLTARDADAKAASETELGQEDDSFADPETAMMRNKLYRQEAGDWHPSEVLVQSLDEYERQGAGKCARLWREEIFPGKSLRRVVIGAPSGGKTYASRWMVIQLAQEAVAALESGKALAGEVIIPAWVAAVDLAPVLKDDSADPLAVDPEATLSAALARTLPGGWKGASKTAFGKWLANSLFSDRGFLVIDALDEVPENGAADARKVLGRFLEAIQRLPLTIVVTCRTSDWTSSLLHEQVPWGVDQRCILELARLDLRRQEQFAKASLPPGLANSLMKQIRRIPGLERVCGTPLILGFLCQEARKNRISDLATIDHIYKRIINSVLRGEWRRDKSVLPVWAVSKSMREEYLHLLEVLCWKLLLLGSGTGRNRFNLDEWKCACNEAARAEQLEESQVEKDGSGGSSLARRLLEDFQKLGLIVGDDSDDPAAAVDATWSFVHRSVFEHLAACGWHRTKTDLAAVCERGRLIAGKIGPGFRFIEGRTINPFWFEPRFVQPILFLAGMMTDPAEVAALYDAVAREPEDMFRQNLLWRLRILSAATCQTTAALRDRAKIACAEWLKAGSGNGYDISAWLNDFLPEMGELPRAMFEQLVGAWLTPPGERHPWLMRLALRFGFPGRFVWGMGDAYFVAHFPEALLPHLRSEAIVPRLTALVGSMGKTWGHMKGLPQIMGLPILLRTLARLGDPAGVRLGIERLRQEATALIRLPGLEALAPLRTKSVRDDLLDLLFEEQNAWNQATIIRILGSLGCFEIEPVLRTGLSAHKEPVVTAAIQSVLESWRRQREPALASGLENVSVSNLLATLGSKTTDPMKRRQAARLLESVGNASILEDLIVLFGDETDPWTRATLSRTIERHADVRTANLLLDEFARQGRFSKFSNTDIFLLAVRTLQEGDQRRDLLRVYNNFLEDRDAREVLTIRQLVVQLWKTINREALFHPLAWVKQVAILLIDHLLLNREPKTFKGLFLNAWREVGMKGIHNPKAWVETVFRVIINRFSRSVQEAAVRMRAVEAFANSGSGGDKSGQLLEWLAKEPEVLVRRTIAVALSSCGDDSALRPLLELLPKAKRKSMMSIQLDGMRMMHSDVKTLAPYITPLLTQRHDSVEAALWKISLDNRKRISKTGEIID